MGSAYRAQRKPFYFIAAVSVFVKHQDSPPPILFADIANAKPILIRIQNRISNPMRVFDLWLGVSMCNAMPAKERNTHSRQ